MGDVDDHTETVHLIDHRKSKRFQSFSHVLQIPAVRIPDTVFIIPRQCDEPDSHIVKSLYPVQIPVDDASLLQCQKC